MKLAILLLTCLSLHGQAILDDWSTGIRTNHNGLPLWKAQIGRDVSVTADGKLMMRPWPEIGPTPIGITSIAFQAVGAFPPGYQASDCAAPQKCAIFTLSAPTVFPATNNDGSVTRSWVFDSLVTTGADCSTWSALQNPTTDLFNLQFNGLYRVDSTHIWFRFGSLDTSSCSFVSGNVRNNCFYSSCGADLQIVTYPYNSTGGFASDNVMPGQTFDAVNMNRLTYDFMLDHSVITPAAGAGGDYSGDCPMSFGFYVQKRTNSAPNLEGDHGYGGTCMSLFANRWYHGTMTRRFNHMATAIANEGYPEDLTFYNGFGLHLHNSETRFYMELLGKNITGPQMASTTSYFDNFVYKAVPNEPDGAFASIIYGYTGVVPGTTTGRYDVGFKALMNQSGETEVRYSTSDMKTSGFSSGTSGGSIPLWGTSNDSYVWNSPDVAEATTMYVGLRPHFQVGAAATGPGGDIMISAGNDGGNSADTFISTGDTVNVLGVLGCTNANGNWTVTQLPRQSFYAANWAVDETGATPGTLLAINVLDGSGTTEITTSSAHGLTVGRMVKMFQTNYNYTFSSVITAVPDSTHFRFMWPIFGPLGVGNYPLTGYSAKAWVYIYSALTLNGSGACSGTFAANPNSRIVATNNTKNFIQLAIPAQDPVVPTTSSLRGGNGAYAGSSKH